MNVVTKKRKTRRRPLKATFNKQRKLEALKVVPRPVRVAQPVDRDDDRAWLDW